MPTILDQLPLTRLRFHLETLEASDVPTFKGDMLRMALLWWLSEFWCPMPDRCREGCRQPETCLFGQLCQPPLDPTWPAKIRRMIGTTPPPAYALWDVADRRTHFEAGTAWRFELTLVGQAALHQVPAVVAAVQQGAERGMGRVRLRSRVGRVVAVCPGDGSETEHLLATAEAGGGPLVWQGGSLDGIRLGWEAAVAWADGYRQPARHLSLRYLSPVKIKERGQWVRVPEFSAVMRAVVRRLRILSVVHGAGEWPQGEFGPLLDLAETVRLEHQETIQTGYQRRSRSAGRHTLEGFVGQAWYAGDDLRPLLPALWLGQWLHIGKAYVLGNGRYVVERVWGE